MRITKCPFCQEKVKIKKLECISCGMSFEGEFFTSPIMALSEEQQGFAELFILNSGSLKQMAQSLGVSYPTVRVRLDEIIDNLKEETKRRQDYRKDILDKIEKGVISPEKGAEIIKNL